MVLPVKKYAQRWGRNFRSSYNNRTQELRAEWRDFSSLDQLEEAFKKPWRSGLSSPKKRASMDYEEYDRVWRGSVIGLYKYASQGDESVFTGDHSDSDAASRSAESIPGLATPRNMEDPPIQASSSPCPSSDGALNDSSLNLCHRCAGINAESLSSKLGYEHGLLSELPSPDQLDQLEDRPISGSIGFCKLCVVFMEALRDDENGDDKIRQFVQDRLRLVLDLEGLEKEQMHQQDHFSTSHVLSDQNTMTKAKPMSVLVLRIMNLDLVEQLENYTGPRGSYPEGTFIETSKLGCLTDENDPNVPFGVTPVRSVGDSTSSAASFEVAAAWLSQCLAADPPETTSLSLQQVESSSWDEDGLPLRLENVSGWPEGSHSPGPERPARLLEIGSGSEGGIVRLIEKTEDNVPYATLSYCWGTATSTGQSEWLTTTTNVHSRKAGFQRSDLPQTLQDSITVSENLGIRHLWIDALCIIQDSKDDWTAEAAKMSGVYLGSLVTIVAASSSSAAHGCFNQCSVSTTEVLRAHEKLISIQSSFSDGRKGNLHIITDRSAHKYNKAQGGPCLELEDLYGRQVKTGPWFDRAWTLQEHVLSRRILFYTSHMLLWECGHCRLSEDRFPQVQGDRLYPLELVDSGAWRGPDSALTTETWYNGLVEQYSSRQMTLEGDRIIAIGALAKATSWGRHIPYLAGLWGDSVRYGMMWRRNGPGSKCKTTTCPSWSWASQSSPISYIFSNLEFIVNAELRDGFKPQVVDARVEAADIKNPFADVKSGYVMLHTKLQTARVLRDFLGRIHPGDNFITEEDRGLFIDSGTFMSQWPVAAYMDDEDMTHEVLVALVGWAGTFIVLLLTPPRLDAEEYRRVGIAILAYYDWYWGTFREGLVDSQIMQWTTRTIKIV